MLETLPANTRIIGKIGEALIEEKLTEWQAPRLSNVGANMINEIIVEVRLNNFL